MYTENYIAKRINELCEMQGISKYQLAKQSGISESSISNLINRHSDPQCSTINKICDGFGITMSQFFLNNEKRCDLTAEQQNILNLWDTLESNDKKLVEAYIEGIKKSVQP